MKENRTQKHEALRVLLNRKVSPLPLSKILIHLYSFGLLLVALWFLIGAALGVYYRETVGNAWENIDLWAHYLGNGGLKISHGNERIMGVPVKVRSWVMSVCLGVLLGYLAAASWANVPSSAKELVHDLHRLRILKRRYLKGKNGE